MLDQLRIYLLARQKPIKGAIAYAVTWIFAHLGLGLDPELAAIIAGAIFAIVVERTKNWRAVFTAFGDYIGKAPAPEPTPQHLERNSPAVPRDLRPPAGTGRIGRRGRA